MIWRPFWKNSMGIILVFEQKKITRWRHHGGHIGMFMGLYVCMLASDASTQKYYKHIKTVWDIDNKNDHTVYVWYIVSIHATVKVMKNKQVSLINFQMDSTNILNRLVRTRHRLHPKDVFFYIYFLNLHNKAFMFGLLPRWKFVP